MPSTEPKEGKKNKIHFKKGDLVIQKLTGNSYCLLERVGFWSNWRGDWFARNAINEINTIFEAEIYIIPNK